MANIKDLKKKIKSTKSTLKITMAMKLVSAAKLARAQAAIVDSRPYAEELDKTIKTMSALVEGYTHQYLREAEEDNKRAILLVISSDRGLCGGYNSQLSKVVREFVKDSPLDLKVSFIGKKVKVLIEKEINLGKLYEFDKNHPTFNEIRDVGEELAALFSGGEYGKVFIAYNIFNSAMSFQPNIKQLLPFELTEGEKEDLAKDFPFDFKYDPSPAEILDSLIPEVYTISIYTCLLDAIAAEHGSRMVAMDNATNNCKDSIKKLTLYMNKIRQAAITTELIEVVSGAEALKG